MRHYMERMLRRYGQTVTVRLADDSETVKALLQPVTSRNEQIENLVTELGTVDERLWLYLGQTEVQPNHSIVWNEMEFQVRSSRPYYIGEQLTYWWAVLEMAKEVVE